jgi:hypothetical protein
MLTPQAQPRAVPSLHPNAQEPAGTSIDRRGSAELPGGCNSPAPTARRPRQGRVDRQVVICSDCGTSAPPNAATSWLETHRHDAHHLPQRLTCPPCQTGTIVASLRDVRDWRWRHATCGLASVPHPRLVG